MYTNKWRSYRPLRSHEYIHFSVNHSKLEYAHKEQFGEQILNVHINTMEGVNHEIRQRFSNKSSRNTERMDLILNEIMYRRSGRSLYHAFKI